jgi:hypothetical protein
MNDGGGGGNVGASAASNNASSGTLFKNIDELFVLQRNIVLT